MVVRLNVNLFSACHPKLKGLSGKSEKDSVRTIGKIVDYTLPILKT